MSGVRRYRYITILYRYRAYADIGFNRYRRIPDIGFTRYRVNTDIGCTPISGIIEINADIGVNITIYRYRRTIRRYWCSARIQMSAGACVPAARPPASECPPRPQGRPGRFVLSESSVVPEIWLVFLICSALWPKAFRFCNFLFSYLHLRF